MNICNVTDSSNRNYWTTADTSIAKRVWGLARGLWAVMARKRHKYRRFACEIASLQQQSFH